MCVTWPKLDSYLGHYRPRSSHGAQICARGLPLTKLFAKFEKGHMVWTVLPHHFWVPATSAWKVTGTKLSLCNCLSFCLPSRPMETASKWPPCPAQPSITLQTGSHVLIPFCGISKYSGFTRNDPPTYHSELSRQTFSPDRHWSKFSANFYPDPKKTPHPLPKSLWFFWTARLLQQHPVHHLEPGAKRTTADRYGRARHGQRASQLPRRFCSETKQTWKRHQALAL